MDENLTFNAILDRSFLDLDNPGKILLLIEKGVYLKGSWLTGTSLSKGEIAYIKNSILDTSLDFFFIWNDFLFEKEVYHLNPDLTNELSELIIPLYIKWAHKHANWTYELTREKLNGILNTSKKIKFLEKEYKKAYASSFKEGDLTVKILNFSGYIVSNKNIRETYYRYLIHDVSEFMKEDPSAATGFFAHPTYCQLLNKYYADKIHALWTDLTGRNPNNPHIQEKPMQKEVLFELPKNEISLVNESDRKFTVEIEKLLKDNADREIVARVMSNFHTRDKAFFSYLFEYLRGDTNPDNSRFVYNKPRDYMNLVNNCYGLNMNRILQGSHGKREDMFSLFNKHDFKSKLP